MIPLYLAGMESLTNHDDPLLYEEFRSGTWVVNKNAMFPFCSIRADHALEQINRFMKVAGGLVGITLNPAALTKFFLIAPELVRLSEEAKLLAGMSSPKQMHHHGLSMSVLTRWEKNIKELTSTIQGFTNPFTENAKDLCNIVTKSVLSEHM